MLKTYEIMTIAKAGLGEDGAKKLSNQVKDIITSFDGKILESNFWGKRKFAYKINHDEYGYYDVIKFEMKGEKIEDLKSKLNLVDNLVRYLVTAF